jgi:hypothetical protein
LVQALAQGTGGISGRESGRNKRNWRVPVTGIANRPGERGNRAGEGGESTTPEENRAGDRGRRRHIERETQGIDHIAAATKLASSAPLPVSLLPSFSFLYFSPPPPFPLSSPAVPLCSSSPLLGGNRVQVCSSLSRRPLCSSLLLPLLCGVPLCSSLPSPANASYYLCSYLLIC